MSCRYFIENLRRAIEISNSERIAKILSNHYELLQQPDFNSELKLILKDSVGVANVRLVELLLKVYAEDAYMFVSINEDSMSVLMNILMMLFRNGRLDIESQTESKENLVHRFIASFNDTDNEDLYPDTVKIVESLINLGISVNEVDIEGWSPLLHSVYTNNFPLVVFLIKKGADIKQRDTSQRTALHIAVEFGNEDTVDYLLSMGIDIPAKDDKGSTALHIACGSQYEKITDSLIHKGADITVKDNNGSTPFSELDLSMWSSPERSDFGCICVMVREISKLIFENLSVPNTDLDLIKTNQGILTYFEKCTKELDQMSKRKFFNSYSYYSVLMMSKKIKKLASLMKNKEFVSKFEDNLTEFSFYIDDLQRILNEAVEVRDRLQIVESKLNYIFEDFFPDIVINKLADNLTLEDLPSD